MWQEYYGEQLNGQLELQVKYILEHSDEYYTQGWKKVFESIRSSKVKRLILGIQNIKFRS